MEEMKKQAILRLKQRNFTVSKLNDAFDVIHNIRNTMIHNEKYKESETVGMLEEVIIEAMKSLLNGK